MMPQQIFVIGMSECLQNSTSRSYFSSDPPPKWPVLCRVGR